MGATCAELDALTGCLWSARTDGEPVAGVEELQQLKARTAPLEADMVAEVDVRDLAKQQLAWGSTADWFTHLAGTNRVRELILEKLTQARAVTPAGWDGREPSLQPALMTARHLWNPHK